MRFEGQMPEHYHTLALLVASKMGPIERPLGTAVASSKKMQPQQSWSRKDTSMSLRLRGINKKGNCVFEEHEQFKKNGIYTNRQQQILDFLVVTKFDQSSIWESKL